MATKIKLIIGGIDYIISSDDSPQYVHALASELNEKLNNMSRKNPYLSTTMASVLVALDCSDREKRALELAEQARTESKRTSDALDCARLEIDEARREIERLNRENRQLRMGINRG